MYLFCRSLFVRLYFFFFLIVLSVLLQYTDSDYLPLVSSNSSSYGVCLIRSSNCLSFASTWFIPSFGGSVLLIFIHFLCCVVLCCDALCYVVLCCVVLWCVVLCCVVVWCGVLCCVVLCCGALCCVVVHCVVLCCDVL